MITTDMLTAKLAPELTEALESRKDQFFASLNPLQRMAMKLVWPRMVSAVPAALEMGLRIVRTEFGKTNLNDLLDWLGKRP